jgi:hypothetical protein
LNKVKEVLTDPGFNIIKDLDVLLKKCDESGTDPYTTINTMLKLDLDRHDVCRHLLMLDISEYIETIIDNTDDCLPPFHVFGKTIKKREVYIKVKIRDKIRYKVFCVSFHFARYPLPVKRPYN